MTTDEVLYESNDGVATVTINRPERRNAMSFGVMDGLRGAMARARADDDVRVVVLTGAGDKAFCAGADLGGGGIGSSGVEAHEGRGLLADLFRDMWGLGKPIIARVRGYALAGGFGLACACDMIVASDDSTFGTPEINVGLVGVHDHGSAAAFDAAEDGARSDDDGPAGAAPTRRRASGFVQRVVPVAELDATVDELDARARGRRARSSCVGVARASTACSRWTPTPRCRTCRTC